MSVKPASYFIFHLPVSETEIPGPGPEWPPVEPSPIPPTTDPIPTVPPVNGLHFQFHAFMLN